MILKMQNEVNKIKFEFIKIIRNDFIHFKLDFINNPKVVQECFQKLRILQPIQLLRIGNKH